MSLVLPHKYVSEGLNDPNLYTPNHILSGLRKLAFKKNSHLDYSSFIADTEVYR